MYVPFYRLREEPFNMTPDPHFMYLSNKHMEALSSLHYGVEWRKGFIELTGEVGAGKTTVCRLFLEQIQNKARTAIVLNPKLSQIQMLQAIAEDFGIPSKGKNKKTLFDALNVFLLETLQSGMNAVLIIDEAQNLGLQALEQVRLISNLETTKQKLIQIILVGQPELRDLLNDARLVQVRQRIAVRYHLKALSLTETEEYVYHRLRIAGARDNDIVFSPQAFLLIYNHSQGVPRLINTVCDKALLAGYVKDSKRITYQIVQEAIRELEGVIVQHGLADVAKPVLELPADLQS